MMNFIVARNWRTVHKAGALADRTIRYMYVHSPHISTMRRVLVVLVTSGG